MHMRSRALFSSCFVSVVLLVLPLAAHAAIPFFGPIIPPQSVTGVLGSDVCAAGWGMLIIVINNIISFSITIAIVFVAPIMIAWAGFLYVVNPYDPSGISKAKGILWNTVIGIVVALAGWMIVDAVMAVFYNPAAPLKAWSDIINWNGDECLIQAGSMKDLKQAVPTAGVVVVPPAVNCATSYATSLPGINVSSTGGCCDKTKSTCTSLDGMLRITTQQIQNVKTKCGAITVTGGTEVGHSGEGSSGSHSGGSKVDISQNLISCIKGTTGSKVITPPSFGSSQVKDRCGNIYTWEGNHTDISVISTCPL